MDQKKRLVSFDKIIIAATAVSFIVTILIYPSLPDRIPYHWGVNSVETAEKWIAFITALAPIGIYFVVKRRSEKGRSEVTAFLVALLLVVIHWVALIISMG